MKRGLDRLTKERRSWNMSRIRGKDTSPELIVRRLLHKMGYRFRLHVRIPIPSDLLSASIGDLRRLGSDERNLPEAKARKSRALGKSASHWIKVRCRNPKTLNLKTGTSKRRRSVSVDIVLPK